jgi:aspartate kinase
MIEVYKFGGASLKDEGSIRNMAEILKNSPRPLVVVVSAMGKTTNTLEAVAHSYFQKDGHAEALWSAIKADHLAIAEALTDRETALEIINAYDRQFVEFLEKNRSEEFTFVYDQIVSLGELLSSSIIAAYLQHQNIKNRWLDVRKIIQTDRAYTEAIVNWGATQTQVSKALTEFDDKLLITQGFLGSTPEGFTTTLGREGSDYSAAVLAFCLNADKLSIWKDVPGVLNADPKQFPDAVLLPSISFHEAIEMSFYGAKVIHPKTIKPLQNKNIPLHVRSFLNPSGEGTLISDIEGDYSLPPVVVYREEHILLSFSVKDFSFIGAENLSLIYLELA